MSARSDLWSESSKFALKIGIALDLSFCLALLNHDGDDEDDHDEADHDGVNHGEDDGKGDPDINLGLIVVDSVVVFLLHLSAYGLIYVLFTTCSNYVYAFLRSWIADHVFLSIRSTKDSTDFVMVYWPSEQILIWWVLMVLLFVDSLELELCWVECWDIRSKPILTFTIENENLILTYWHH